MKRYRDLVKVLEKRVEALEGIIYKEIMPKMSTTPVQSTPLYKILKKQTVSKISSPELFNNTKPNNFVANKSYSGSVTPRPVLKNILKTDEGACKESNEDFFLSPLLLGDEEQ